MSGRIFQFTNTFGAFTGLKLYLNRKYKKSSVVSFSFLKHPVHFRAQYTTSDLSMFEQIFYSKHYEISVPFAPKIIFDLGANVGFASIYFANRFPGSQIIAIEPNAENYKSAVMNSENYDNIKMIYDAVWNRHEELHVVDKGHGEAAFMIEPGKGENEVPAYTIKSLMQMMKTDEIDILKIDIEGSEKEIFETGYEDWLPKTKIVIVETHDRYRKGTSKAVMETICKYYFSLELSGENLVFYNNNLINAY